MKEHEKDRVTNRTHGDDPYRNSQGTSNLVRLKDTDDLKIVKEDPDVRGWPVLTADNLEVGKVDELIIDTTAMKVRYMVVDLYDDYAADKIDHYLLLPIGAARLHEKENKVLVSGIKSTTVLNYPVYRSAPVTRDYEHSIRNYFERGGILNTSTGPVPGSTSPTTGTTIVQTDEDHIHGHADRDSIRSTGTRGPIPGSTSPMTGRTIEEVGGNNIHGHVGGTSSTDVHGTTGRHDIESSHMENPDRMSDTTRADTDSILGESRTGTEHRRSLTGEKELGTPNFTTGGDFRQRSRTSGLTPRTSSLENKEIVQGPSGETEKTEWDAQRPHHQEGEWNDTSNLNSSTSLSNEPKRGSTLGNAENRPQYHTDRERAASPEHVTRKPGDPSTDDFYDHDHFDEEVFYVRRRRREEE